MKRLSNLLSANQCRLAGRINQYDHSFYNELINQTTIDLLEGGENREIVDFSGNRWETRINVQPVEGDTEAMEVAITFRLTEGSSPQTSVAVDVCFDDWSSDNYVLIPGAAYNGNRFESRKIRYSPKLYDPKDIGPDKPEIISDVPRLNIHDGPSFIQDRSGSATVPSMGFHAPHRQRGFWLLTEQSNRLGDYGYTIKENKERDQAIFRITSPVVRETYRYIITDNQYPSDDVPHDFQEKEEVTIKARLYFFYCPSIQTLFDRHIPLRNVMENHREIPVLFPFSSTFPIQEQKFNTQNWVEPYGYYSVGMREIFLQDWQIGWTGGMITTYPLLFEGQRKTKDRVLRMFDWLFPDGVTPSGFFYDCGESDEEGMHWYGGDIRKPYAKDWHLIRKSGDAIYYIIKQFWLMQKMGVEVKDHWKNGTQKAADAFVRLWDKWHQFGQFVDSNTGDVVVGGSTSAGIVPAGLVYAAQFYNNQAYMRVAKESADYFYNHYVRNGITNGGVGDAMANPDSESGYGLLESFTVLYEQTRHEKWLNCARDLANQYASWIMSYNFRFPKDCLLGQLDIRTTGTVFANTQNKHGAPGICTHSGIAFLRLYRATNDPFYIHLLRDIARHSPQMLSHPSRPIEGMPEGWMTERVSTTDWFEGIGEIMYGTTFAETSLMLMTVEIPGVYVQPHRSFVFSFDHLQTQVNKDTDKQLTIEITNPSNEPVNVKILTEREQDLQKPLQENALWDSHTVHLDPGGSEEITCEK